MQPPHLTPGLPLRRFAWLWLAAAAGVAVVRSFEPFDHGIWLVAYLALVGWLAQLLLGRGQAELAPVARPRVRSEVLLWNVGVVLVPAGELADVRLLVAIGSVALIVALLLFLEVLRPDRRARAGRPVLRQAYLGLLGFMAVSVVIGMWLSSDVPWLG